jgi:hypothetical protein
MLMPLRQLFAVAVLPFTVAVIVPVWIARRNHIRFAIPADLVSVALVVAGAMTVAIGFELFTSSLYLS